MNDSKIHIITVAASLFLQKSFKEVTMKEIVEKTGLSKGAFYHYFESKEQLFKEALEYLYSKVLAYDYESYNQDSLYIFYHELVEGGVKMWKKFTTIIGNEKDHGSGGMNHFTLVFDALKLFPDFSDWAVDRYKAEIETWRRIVENARRSGEINPPISDEEVAKLYVSAADGRAIMTMIKNVPIREIMEDVLNTWDSLYKMIKA